MSLDGREITGFEQQELLGKGGCATVYSAVVQLGNRSPLIPVAAKHVGPPFFPTLQALREPLCVGTVLAVRCTDEDIDTSLLSLLVDAGIAEDDGRSDLYWLCKVKKRAGHGTDQIAVQWLEQEDAEDIFTLRDRVHAASKGYPEFVSERNHNVKPNLTVLL